MRIASKDILVLIKATKLIYSIPLENAPLSRLGTKYMNIIIDPSHPEPTQPIVTYSFGHPPDFYKIKTCDESRDVSLFGPN